MKRILAIYSAPRGHWSGDGFPVRTLFRHDRHGGELTPFLLCDYAGPTCFEPATTPRGVGEHPHHGFAMLTIVYAGEIEHRDSTGACARLGPGDAQWMTAAAGIRHAEMHTPAFTKRGGLFEMVQLWVNLPAASRTAPPAYRLLPHAAIPKVAIPGGAGSLRVIAGHYEGHRGPARTPAPLDIFDVHLAGGKAARFELPAGHTTAIVVLHGGVAGAGKAGNGGASSAGDVEINGSDKVREAQVAVLERAGTSIELAADGAARLLLLGGEPIAGPVAGPCIGCKPVACEPTDCGPGAPNGKTEGATRPGQHARSARLAA